MKTRQPVFCWALAVLSILATPTVTQLNDPEDVHLDDVDQESSFPYDMTKCTKGPCAPGNEACGAPFQDAPGYHLMDQRGCGENDPNAPIFDPVHGVIHHFFQLHIAYPPDGGMGAIYGHFVSKDFVHWAQLPVPIWNGLDISVTPWRRTTYDTRAIYTGSALIVDGAGPGGKGPGVVQIYPGLCNKTVWPSCQTGCLLVQAVPADYNDELLTNWTKPNYNPIVENAQRDPSTPWRLPTGEWRLRTYNSMVYTADSDADLLAGRWHTAGSTKDFKTCECPSFYPLPPPTPGFEAAYEEATRQGRLPSHVHKYSCDLTDYWQLGTYTAGAPRTTGSYNATPGWEDMHVARSLDHGVLYASKDSEYPTKTGSKRRVNWGWARVHHPDGIQTLPRVITFNALGRTLEQAPLEELQDLRLDAAFQADPGVKVHANVPYAQVLKPGVAKQSEAIVTIALPERATTFGVTILVAGNTGSHESSVTCVVTYTPPQALTSFHEVPVACGSIEDSLRIVGGETELEIRIFSDHTVLEAYFQKGRIAMTVPMPSFITDDADILFTSSADVTLKSAVTYPLRGIWVTPDDVRSAPRVYPSPKDTASGAAGLTLNV